MKRLIHGARLHLIVLVGTAMAGCATVPGGVPVKSGDRAAVRFTCRLANGDIAITTEKRLEEDPSSRKSPLFVARGAEGAPVITAGAAASSKLLPFEDRVMEKIAAAIVGMSPGEQRTVPIRGDRKDNASLGADSLIKVARVMHRPKELTVDKETVLSRSGRPPAVGDRLDLGKEQLPATVLAVNGTGVTVRFSPIPGMRIDTPFGRGTVKETPTDFEIIVDDPVGSLVRSGPLAGRIINLSDTEVTIDYGDPFGGEELSCDIVVEAPAAEKDKGVARAE